MSVDNMPSNYFAADTMLKGKDVRTIANNTRLRRVRKETTSHGIAAGTPGIAVVLHNTEVVIHWLGGNFTINSGGWETYTTKARINAALPFGFRVSQRKHRWYVDIRQGRNDDGSYLWESFGFCSGDTFHVDEAF